MRKWMPAVLIAISFAASVLLYSGLTSPVFTGLHKLLPPQFGAGADTIPALVALFGLPTVALLVWALLFEAPVSRLGLAAGRVLFNAPAPRYDVFAPTYRLIVLWAVSLVLSVHLALLAEALQWSIQAGTIVGITLGGGMMVVGNAIPRLRPNAVAGIRTARTMNDPAEWARVHRTFGAVLLAVGIVTVIASIVAPRYALATGLGLLFLSSAAALVTARN